MGMQAARGALAGSRCPAALPLILTGVRVSAVQVVATATLGAFVGFGGLGAFIIEGFASPNDGKLLDGRDPRRGDVASGRTSVRSAADGPDPLDPWRRFARRGPVAFALVDDADIRPVRALDREANHEEKAMFRKIRGLWRVLAVFALLAAACGDDDSGGDTEGASDSDGEDAGGDPRRAGHHASAPRTSASRHPGRDLRAGAGRAGYRVEHPGARWLPRPRGAGVRVRRHQPGARVRGVDARVPQRDAGEATGDVDETAALLDERLAEIGLGRARPPEAVDTNAFVVTPETAESWAERCPTSATERATSPSGHRRTARPTPSASPGCRRSTGST